VWVRLEVLVALSREEQRLLDEMEAALSEEDPALKVRLRSPERRPLRWLRALCAGVVFMVGLTLLVAGMSAAVALSVVGYVVMVAAAVVGVFSWSGVDVGRLEPPPPDL
jgi:hypothetical protein